MVQAPNETEEQIRRRHVSYVPRLTMHPWILEKNWRVRSESS